MDSEPPTGDDLTRMIVSMKRNVFDRTKAPRSRRRRFHGGVIAAVLVVIALGTASGAVALGVVPQPFAAPASAPPSASVTRSAPPATPTPTSAPAPVIPTTCTAVVDAADYARFFGTTPVQLLRPVPSDSSAVPIPLPGRVHPAFFDAPALACLWHDPRADITNLSIEMGTAPAADTSTYLAELPSEGFLCSRADGGTSCHKTTPDAEFPVSETVTFFVRGTTWLEIRQTNFPTSDLLGSLTSHLWNQ